MKEYEWGGFRVEIDEETTRDYYSDSIEWDCTCGHCRNFVELARRRELPGDVLELLDKLSILPEKASYVCELYDKDGMLYYEVAYRLSGRILSGRSNKSTPFGDVEALCCREIAPGTAEEFPEPWFDVEFYLWLPWVLDEPIGGPID